jgi:HEAT repeat protein
MPVTMDQVRSFLDSDEPDYPEAARQLGPDALPHLQTLVAGNDPLLASKAAYLAGQLGTAQSSAVVALAAESPYPEVRVAAAAAARHLPAPQADTVLSTVLADSDVGVRKVALRSAAAVQTPGLKHQIQEMSRNDSNALIRTLAAQTANDMP